MEIIAHNFIIDGIVNEFILEIHWNSMKKELGGGIKSGIVDFNFLLKFP